MNRFVRSVAQAGTFVLLLIGAQCGWAVAQTSDPSATPALDDDRAVVGSIVMNAVSELKLCGLAVEKTQSPDIRAFCKRETADDAHTALAGMQLAQRIGASRVKLQPSPGTPQVLDSLAQSEGADFDRKFLLAQIESTENDEHSLRYEVEVATDKSVRRYEGAVLPTVEEHLDLAETALRKISEAGP